MCSMGGSNTTPGPRRLKQGNANTWILVAPTSRVPQAGDVVFLGGILQYYEKYYKQAFDLYALTWEESIEQVFVVFVVVLLNVVGLTCVLVRACVRAPGRTGAAGAPDYEYYKQAFGCYPNRRTYRRPHAC